MRRIPISNLRGMSKRQLLAMQEPYLIESHSTPVAVIMTWAQYETARGLASGSPVPGPAVVEKPLDGDSAL